MDLFGGQHELRREIIGNDVVKFALNSPAAKLEIQLKTGRRAQQCNIMAEGSQNQLKRVRMLIDKVDGLRVKNCHVGKGSTDDPQHDFFLVTDIGLEPLAHPGFYASR